MFDSNFRNQLLKDYHNNKNNFNQIRNDCYIYIYNHPNFNDDPYWDLKIVRVYIHKNNLQPKFYDNNEQIINFKLPNVTFTIYSK